jgi:transposase
MSRRKTPYPKEFRQQMVELVQAGRQPKDLAKEFGCHADSIRSWVTQLGPTQSGASPGQTPLNACERQELIELRRKYKQLQQERDILAKATAWFANNGVPTFTTSTR